MVATFGGTLMESVMMANTVSPLLLLLVVFFHPIIFGLIVKILLIPTITAASMSLYIVPAKNVGP